MTPPWPLRLQLIMSTTSPKEDFNSSLDIRPELLAMEYIYRQAAAGVQEYKQRMHALRLAVVKEA